MSHVPRLVTYSPEELLALAREHVPFYQRAYADLPENLMLAQAPIIDQKSYWEAHTRDPRELLSEPLHDGVVLNSGGSTGEPKFSYFNNAEWDSGVALEARAIAATGVTTGDRVANFFASGFLYFSFILMLEALKATNIKVLQLPIGYFAPLPDATRLMRAFRVNVIAGLPTHLMGLVDHQEKQGITDVRLDRILFAGEPFTADQRSYLQGRFPGVEIRSLGYASVDGGIIGYADAGCGPGEHRVFDGAAILEVVDEESNTPILESDRPGKLVFTNLTRRLMPTLRYPTGDRGQWVEPAGTAERKFLLLGRAEESARLASFNVPVAEVAALLAPFRERLGIRHFQLVVTQENLRDKLTLRLVSELPALERNAAGTQIVETLLRQKPVLGEMVARGVVNPVAVEWTGMAGLEVNARTGKTRTVVDRRVG